MTLSCFHVIRIFTVKNVWGRQLLKLVIDRHRNEMAQITKDIQRIKKVDFL